MINSIGRYLSEATQSVKIAAGTSVATITTGTISEWIPTNFGDIGIIIGATLSIVLIYTHIRKSQREKQLHVLEMETKTLELKLLKEKAESK